MGKNNTIKKIIEYITKAMLFIAKKVLELVWHIIKTAITITTIIIILATIYKYAM